MTVGNNVVVTKDIPDNCVAGGVLARMIKRISDDTAFIEEAKGLQ